MHKYQDLLAWQKSMNLVELVYNLTNQFPSKEQFGLIAQINRCAISIPSNIAEGAGRNTKGEFNQFLGIAVGSLFELQTQLMISSRINYTNEEDINPLLELIEEIHKMLFGLKKKL
ncbi:MAG: four helix bundle protein [Fulvivirga sp.]|uniref:four helix bundle protein n=1 Tax=Fulvivirga sp. TaxID=1931237 RepID=UPI0032EBA1B2